MLCPDFESIGVWVAVVGSCDCEVRAVRTRRIVVDMAYWRLFTEALTLCVPNPSFGLGASLELAS